MSPPNGKADGHPIRLKNREQEQWEESPPPVTDLVLPSLKQLSKYFSLYPRPAVIFQLTIHGKSKFTHYLPVIFTCRGQKCPGQVQPPLLRKLSTILQNGNFLNNK